jgi:C1A family cysteine protease
MTKRLGWIPDLPDHRDHNFKLNKAVTVTSLVDLRPHCPPVYDQGQLGSCTANAIGAAIEFCEKKENHPDFMPSRLFIYYRERAIEGSIFSDSGAQLRDGIKAVNQKGVCKESTWPYDEGKFTQNPSTAAWSEAAKHKALSYQRIDNTSMVQMKQCLASGFPFVFGFTVYDSFMSDQVAQTGIVPMPSENESVQGGHAVLAVGYDDSKRAFIVRNSWGADWGLKGYFYMPYEYVTDTDLADDFWEIKVVA